MLSLAGAGAALLIVLGIAFEGRRLSSFTLLLAGVTMNSISLAIVLFLHNLASFSQSFAISRWLMGGLDAVEYSTLAWLAAAVIPVCALVIARSRQWNLLAVGEEWASSRGLSTTTYTVLGYIAGSFLTGIVTSLTGPIGFVGLIVPHALRLKLGADHRVLLPCSFLLGAAFLALCDTLSRTVHRAHRNSRRRGHRASRRTVFHLAAALQTEEPVAVILIGGGARSGKSRYALEKARAITGTRAFVATAEASDEEMTLRIRHHREERGEDFSTIEEPLELARDHRRSQLRRVADRLPNPLAFEHHVRPTRLREIDKLIQAAQSAPRTVIFVTNEVGSGIVPTDNALSREFRDHAGILNQRIAAIADEVYLMIFGQPLRVK